MKRTLIRIGLLLLLALAIAQGVMMGLNTGNGARKGIGAQGPEDVVGR